MSERATRTLAMLALLLLAVACDSGTDAGGGDAPPATDAAAETAAAPDTTAESDAGAAPDTPAGADGTTPPDVGPAADAAVDTGPAPDTVPPDQALAWVFADPDRVGVEPPVMRPLPHLTDPEGRLTGAFADVWNCLNEPGGVETTQMVNGSPLTIALCRLEKTVRPDPDGNYLSVVPPANWKNPDDPFAEVQMYWHVSRVHDWFAETFGYTGMDRPLQALVNLQVGLKIGNYAWFSIDNAAYMPAESIEQLGQMIGVAPPIQGDAIIFAQGPSLDLSYDGDVVYHEYGHAVVGGERLWGVRADEFGPDMAPLSLNEAHADYFTAALTESPVIGLWSLGTLGAARDLSEERRCPDHVIGESHWDGQVFSSALWGVRVALGGELADALVFDALQTYDQLTGFDDAVAAIVAGAAALDPPRDVEVAAVFARHGLPGCDRVVPLEADARSDVVFVPGRFETGIPAFEALAPGYTQASFPVAEGTVAVTLAFDVAPSDMDDLLGMLGYSAEPAELSVALKRGGAAIRWTYGAAAQSDAHAVLAIPRDGEHYELTLAGTCLVPGRHTLQLASRSSGGAAVRRVRVTEWTAAPGADVPVAAYDCAPDAE